MSLAAHLLLLGLAAEPVTDAGTSPPGISGEGLTRPQLLTKPPYPPPGVHIRGVVMVKCRVLVIGRLENCTVISVDGTPPNPFLVEMMRQWASTAQLYPARSKGEPVEVDYVFNFNYR